MCAYAIKKCHFNTLYFGAEDQKGGGIINGSQDNLKPITMFLIFMRKKPLIYCPYSFVIKDNQDNSQNVIRPDSKNGTVFFPDKEKSQWILLKKIKKWAFGSFDSADQIIDCKELIYFPRPNRYTMSF